METSIFRLLLNSNPEVLLKLDKLHRELGGHGISEPPAKPLPPVNYEYRGAYEDYKEEMRQKPGRDE